MHRLKFKIKQRLIRYKKRLYDFGDEFADKIARVAGSWLFIISAAILLTTWMSLNIYAGMKAWDPYPFILLNLLLSCMAAVQAPIIMMSQNRQEKRDRAKVDFNIDLNKLQTGILEQITQAVAEVSQVVGIIKVQIEDGKISTVTSELATEQIREQLNRIEETVQFLRSKEEK